MNEKITNLLGEELTNQVKEKLGSVELGIINDGTLVPAEKYDNLKKDFSNTKSELETVSKQLDDNTKTIEELTQQAGMTEELKAKLEDMNKTTETLKQEATQREINMSKTYAIKSELAKSNANPDAISYLVNEFNLENIELDGDKIKDWDNILEPIRENKKSLFGESKITGGGVSSNNIIPNANTWQASYNKASTNLEKIKIKQQAKAEGVNL